MTLQNTYTTLILQADVPKGVKQDFEPTYVVDSSNTRTPTLPEKADLSRVIETTNNLFPIPLIKLLEVQV
ncbi:hypothetical protein [Nostoc sp. CENA543]|uniref:hypothetical protein n=1 Tax=Nostoc sp. CENA543 TaxID=1869241 RepID=UPI001CEF7CEF|nr:hypothetical protein [Nostoc sp. CENA543]